jgi:hypothetical protein
MPRGNPALTEDRAGLAGDLRSGLCPDAPSRGPNPARSFVGASF